MAEVFETYKSCFAIILNNRTLIEFYTNETGIQYPTHDNDLTEPRAAGELTEGSNHAGSMAEAVGTIKSCFAILLKDRPLIGLWYKKHSHKQKITGASYKKPTGRGKHSSMKKEGLPSK